MLSLKTNGLDKHAKGMSLHLGYFDTASRAEGSKGLTDKTKKETEVSLRLTIFVLS